MLIKSFKTKNRKSWLRLQCDQCGKQRTIRSLKKFLEKDLHFCPNDRCANEAQRGDGVLARQKKRILQKRYGVDNAFQIPAVQEQIRQKHLKNLGVECPTQSAAVRERVKKTVRKRYGVDNVFQDAVVKKKIHQTRKRNGAYKFSKIENEFYKFLCGEFGDANVTRQIPMNNSRWPIDFYVSVLDLYIQFDGVYWHGLDRPIEIIAEGKTPRDKTIYCKWKTDREQENWFANQGLRLVRVTDKQFEKMNAAELIGIMTCE